MMLYKLPKKINGKTFNWPIYDEEGKVFTIETRLENKLDKEVKRVEISWSGLKLRNWKGKETFYADPDTGDLIIGGTLLQDASYMTVPQEVMNDINKDPNITDSVQNTPNHMLKSNIRLLGDEPATSQITELSKDEQHTIKEYLINELINDRIKEIKHQDEEKKVHFLTPNVAAVKIGDYIDWKAISISNEILEDALESRGRIESRLNSVADIINQNIGYKYTPALKNINNPIQVSTLPDNLNDTTDLYKVYEVSSTQEIFWWDGTAWQRLEPNNINLGTGASLNLIGANATFMAGSELKMLAGGDLHIFGGQVFISSQKDNDSITTTTITDEETQINKTVITTPVTNGIVLDDNGLAIYSSRNITVGVMGKTSIEGTDETVNISSGFELNSQGDFTVVTKETNGAKTGAIKFYRYNNENKLTAGVVIDGDGFTVNTGGAFNVQSNNFILNSEATGSQPLMSIMRTNNGVTSGLQFAANGTLTITGEINATSGWIGNKNDGWYIGKNTLKDSSGNSYYVGYIGSNSDDRKASIGIRNTPNNGDANFKNFPALWIGGTYDENQEPVAQNNASLNALFRVNSDGKLHAEGAYIKGTIEATSGWFGTAAGFHIGPNGTGAFIGNNSNIKQATFGLDTTAAAWPAFWLGGVRSIDDKTINPSLPFYVTGQGKLYASGATIGGSTNINTTGNIQMSGGEFSVSTSVNSIVMNTNGVKLTANSDAGKDNSKIIIDAATILFRPNERADSKDKFFRVYVDSTQDNDGPVGMYGASRVLWFRTTGNYLSNHKAWQIIQVLLSDKGWTPSE